MKKENDKPIHIVKNDKHYRYENLNEMLVSNCLSIFSYASMIADAKQMFIQEEKVDGIYTHLYDNVHTKIYYVSLDIIKTLARINLDVIDNKPIEVYSMLRVGDEAAIGYEYSKLLKAHKEGIGGTYVDSEKLFDFEFVFNIDSLSFLLNSIKDYEHDHSSNAVYNKIPKPDSVTETSIKNTIYPLYNYLDYKECYKN